MFFFDFIRLIKFWYLQSCKMTCAIAGCWKLKSLNLSSFKTVNAVAIQAKFYGWTSLSSLNIENFDTSKITNMSYIKIKGDS